MFLLFLICHISPVVSEIHMALFWGVPMGSELCQNSTISWDQCYQKCYDSDGCLFSFQNGSFCYICDFNTTNSVSFSKYSSGCKVALKYDLTTCPASIKTLSGTVIRANVVLGGVSYNITGSSDGSSLSFAYVPIRCQTGWQFFQRIKCGWCIKVFQSYSTLYATAQTLCASEGAILTGMENTNEMNYIKTTAQSFVLNTASYQIIWVDGVRKTICNTLATLGKCPYTFQDAFNYQDTCASGQGGYIGAPPNGANVNGIPQGCLCIDILPASLSGHADDESCLTPSQPLGYACGKLSIV